MEEGNSQLLENWSKQLFLFMGVLLFSFVFILTKEVTSTYKKSPPPSQFVDSTQVNPFRKSKFELVSKDLCIERRIYYQVPNDRVFLSLNYGFSPFSHFFKDIPFAVTSPEKKQGNNTYTFVFNDSILGPYVKDGNPSTNLIVGADYNSKTNRALWKVKFANGTNSKSIRCSSLDYVPYGEDGQYYLLAHYCPSGLNEDCGSNCDFCYFLPNGDSIVGQTVCLGLTGASNLELTYVPNRKCFLVKRLAYKEMDPIAPHIDTYSFTDGTKIDGSFQNSTISMATEGDKYAIVHEKDAKVYLRINGKDKQLERDKKTVFSPDYSDFMAQYSLGSQQFMRFFNDETIEVFGRVFYSFWDKRKQTFAWLTYYEGYVQLHWRDKSESEPFFWKKLSEQGFNDKSIQLIENKEDKGYKIRIYSPQAPDKTLSIEQNGEIRFSNTIYNDNTTKEQRIKNTFLNYNPISFNNLYTYCSIPNIALRFCHFIRDQKIEWEDGLTSNGKLIYPPYFKKDGLLYWIEGEGKIIYEYRRRL